MMRSAARGCLVAILVAALVNLPALAADEKPLGTVLQAQDAELSHANAAVGTTVYPGDALATQVGGTLRLRIGQGQIYLLSSSAARLGQTENRVQASVTRGTVGFSTSGAELLELLTPEGIVRAANKDGAFGQVTLTGPSEMLVSAYRGALVLDTDGELHPIAAGTSYRVVLESEEQGPQGAGTGGGPGIITAKKRKIGMYVVIVAAAGLTSLVIYRELAESPSAFDKE